MILKVTFLIDMFLVIVQLLQVIDKIFQFYVNRVHSKSMDLQNAESSIEQVSMDSVLHMIKQTNLFSFFGSATQCCFLD